MYKRTAESLKSFYRFFRSAKATITIIIVLMALFFAGLIIPQKALFQSKAQYDAWKAGYPAISGFTELFRLNEIYVAPVTVFFLTLFFINLIIVISYRVPLILKRAYLQKEIALDIEALKNDPDVKTISIPNTDHEHIMTETKSFLKKRLWFFLNIKGKNSLFAIKNRYSPLGFLFFHLSFLLCLIGGLFVMYTRFSGNLILTEGQIFDSDIAQFRSISRDPKIFKALPPLGITLEKVTPKYEKDAGTDLSVQMKVKHWDKIDDVTVKVNQPVKRDAVSILATSIGVSPLFILNAADGKELSGGYFSLKVLNREEDSFEFENMPHRYFVRFYPDYAEKDGKEYSLSKELKNPVIRLRVEAQGKPIYEGLLGLGQKAAFDSFSLSFADIRYWVDFLVVREYGNLPLFIGFLSGAAGLVMRLIFYQKTLKICIEKQGQNSLIYILGQSEYYKYSFREELDKIVLSVKSCLGDMQPPQYENYCSVRKET